MQVHIESFALKTLASTSTQVSCAHFCESVRSNQETNCWENELMKPQKMRQTMRQTWFKQVFGFEETLDNVTNKFTFDNGYLKCKGTKNQTSYYVGDFECPKISELKKRLSINSNESNNNQLIQTYDNVTINENNNEKMTTNNNNDSNQRINNEEQKTNEKTANNTQNMTAKKILLKFENMVGDVQTLICEKNNQGSVFQVASQFNCLEMINPGVSPSRGITGYIGDPTQGPACALWFCSVLCNCFLFPHTHTHTMCEIAKYVHCCKNINIHAKRKLSCSHSISKLLLWRK